MYICNLVCLIIIAASSCGEIDANLFGLENSTKTIETDTNIYARENSTDHSQTKDNSSSRVNTTLQSETAANMFKWVNFTGHEQQDNSYNRSNQKIVGGTMLLPNSRPYLVYLQSYVPGVSLKICGSTIYNENYIITAAHCVYGLTYWERRGLGVYAGVHSLSVNEVHEQWRSVSNIIIHPIYNAVTHDNDIALLKVNASLDLTGIYVRPLEINTDASCPLVGSRCHVAGWGRLSEGGSSPDVPYEVDVTVMSNEACNVVNDVEYFYKIFDFHICAGDTGKDSCQGDSGGPFVCSCGGRDTLAGIVSRGKGCARPGLPGVYTRVSFYRDWITTTTGSTTTLSTTTTESTTTTGSTTTLTITTTESTTTGSTTTESTTTTGSTTLSTTTGFTTTTGSRISTNPTTSPTTSTTRSTTRTTTTANKTFNWSGDHTFVLGSAPDISFSYVTVLFISFCLVGCAKLLLSDDLP